MKVNLIFNFDGQLLTKGAWIVCNAFGDMLASINFQSRSNQRAQERLFKRKLKQSQNHRIDLQIRPSNWKCVKN